MTIRNKLALRFMLLASLILGVALLVVYTMSARYRLDEFRVRIYDRGVHTANLLLQMDGADKELLWRIEQENPTLVPSESIRIFDHDDQEVYSSGTWRLGVVDRKVLDKVRTARGIVDLEEGGEAIGFLFTGKHDRFVVLVSGEDRFGRSKLGNLRDAMLMTYAFGVIITFIVGRVYAQRALEPLKRLVEEMRSMHSADLLQRVEVGEEGDEIAQLASSFNELLDRLEKAFNAQRNFIANASHELRTPLTVISGQLEVLLLMDRSAGEYRTAVASVLEDMRSLNKLSNRLLLLAQTDNLPAHSGFEPVRIDEILWQARAEVLRNKSQNVVDVTMVDLEEERFMQVAGVENLLRSMVFNLMENGCKYSPDDRVEVKLFVENGSIRMDVTDRGIGIPETERDRIFNPFFRGSNTTGHPGHGIGLSLVRRIAELHGGSVSFRNNEGGGTMFSVSLPHL